MSGVKRYGWLIIMIEMTELIENGGKVIKETNQSLSWGWRKFDWQKWLSDSKHLIGLRDEINEIDDKDGVWCVMNEEWGNIIQSIKITHVKMNTNMIEKEKWKQSNEGEKQTQFIWRVGIQRMEGRMKWIDMR